MLGTVKLDNNLLTCDQGNFNQITAWSRSQILATVVRDTCSTTVPPAAPLNGLGFTRGMDCKSNPVITQLLHITHVTNVSKITL